MKIELEIQAYHAEQGLTYEWGDDCVLKTRVSNNEVVLSGNRAALIELAKQLLTLAQEDVPSGNHIHYDDWNMLQKGSVQLVVTKLP